MTQEPLKEKVELLEELMKQKISQANVLKESMKPIEAYAAATKEFSKKVEDIILPKKLESLDMLSKQKMSGEFYRFLIEMIDQLTGLVRNSRQDSEKLLLAKQTELNFLAQEFNHLKEKQNKIIAESNNKKVQDDNKEYVRPDQNPNTKIGRASIDIQQRKKAAATPDEAKINHLE